MNLFFVSGSFSPICGDDPSGRMVANLSGALSALGHKVTVCAPLRDPEIADRYSLAMQLSPLVVDFPQESVSLQVYDGRLPSGVEIKLLGHEQLFEGRPPITDDDDEPLRHAALARGALALAEAEQLPWHVIHGAGLPGALAMLLASRMSCLALTKRVLFVDRLDLQGRCHHSWVERMGLGWEGFTPEGYEFYGDLNLLKAGLVSADRLVFDGPGRVAEVMTPEGGHGLEGLLRHRRADLFGLLPGLDYSRWNPTTDPAIPARFDAEQPDGKPTCKTELQHRVGLPVSRDIPLIGVLPPLDELGPALARVLERVLRGEVELIVPRGVEAQLEAILTEGAERWSRQIARIELDDPGWHQLIAGADLLLLDAPQRSEADLLLAALRYGTIPIVKRAGLVRELVVDLSPDLSSGNGFLVSEDDPSELVAVIRRAVATLHATPRCGEMVRRVMSRSSSWEESARQIEQIYAEMMPSTGQQVPEPCTEPQ